MKKSNLRAIILMAATLTINNAGAQSILNKVKSAVKSSSSSTSSNTSSSSSSTSSVSSILGSLIGSSKVSESDVVGTWTYQEPAVAFESENVLKSAGGAVAATTVENKMSTTLTKYGFTKGETTIVFGEDNSYTCTAKGKTVSGTYSISGSTISFKQNGVTAAKGNVKLSNDVLQITFDSDALLKGMSALGSISSNSTISSISKLAGSYDGMQIGMKFSK